MTIIIEKINACVTEYWQVTGKKPERIYMGLNEMQSLADWARSLEPWRKDELIRHTAEVGRTKIMGLMVYEVNDDQPHMRCSI